MEALISYSPILVDTRLGRTVRVTVLVKSLQVVLNLEVAPVLTVLQLRKIIAEKLGQELKYILLVLKTQQLKNYQTVSEHLGENSEELTCEVVHYIESPKKIMAYPLRVSTVLRCLDGKPENTCVFWFDIERDRSLCFSEKMKCGRVFHKYINTQRVHGNEEVYTHEALRLLLMNHRDDLMVAEDIQKHIQIKSLFEMALTVFARRITTPNDRSELIQVTQSFQTGIDKQRKIDLCLTPPNSKLDCLSIVKKYKAMVLNALRNKDFPEAKKDIYESFYLEVLDVFASIQVAQESHEIHSMQSAAHLALAKIYRLLKNESSVGVYFEDCVSGVGLLSLIAEKLENFLWALEKGKPNNLIRK